MPRDAAAQAGMQTPGMIDAEQRTGATPSVTGLTARDDTVLQTSSDASERGDQRTSASRDGPDDEARHQMISEAAHRRYRERNYADGSDFDDWLDAEAEVDRLLAERQGSERRSSND